MSTTWVRFKKRFNFIPAKASAVTLQYDAGAVDAVNAEAFAKAVPRFAEEIEAPANEADAKALRSGELEPTVKKVDDKPTEKPADAPAPAGAGKPGKA